MLIEVIFRRGGKKKFLLVQQKGFFGGEKWIVAEPGFWGPKKIGEATTYDGAIAIIAAKYGEIRNIIVLKRG